MTNDKRAKTNINSIHINVSLWILKKNKYQQNIIISKYIIIILGQTDNDGNLTKQLNQMSFLFHYFK